MKDICQMGVLVDFELAREAPCFSTSLKGHLAMSTEFMGSLFPLGLLAFYTQ